MKYFKLDQTVYHPIYGEGKVVTGCLDKYPIQIQFINHICSFTYDGRETEGSKITLSQNPIPEIVNTPLRDEYIPFTFQDRELLKGKWIKEKNNSVWETMITFINDRNVGVDNRMYYSYKELLEKYEFVDGKPCGKLAN